MRVRRHGIFPITISKVEPTWLAICMEQSWWFTGFAAAAVGTIPTTDVASTGGRISNDRFLGYSGQHVSSLTVTIVFCPLANGKIDVHSPLLVRGA